MRDLINKIFKTAMFRDLVSKHWRTALVVLGVVVTVFIISNVIAPAAIAGLCPDGKRVVDGLEDKLCFIQLTPSSNVISNTIANWLAEKAYRIIAGVLYLAMEAEGWMLGAVGMFANWMLQSGPITTSTVVLVGWGVTRDLANMFFILILLGVALDYILFQSFGVKRALPMLIAVALLINFSLPIAGIFIDFANVFTNFFMDKITVGCRIIEGIGKSCGFTETIAANINLTNLFSMDNTMKNGVAKSLIPDILFAIFFMAGTIFIFLALGIMFLLRTGWLYALLILLPLVLVLMPFPKTSQYFGRWSNQFFKWTMFAPVASFFLYLSMLVFNANVEADLNQRAGGLSDDFIQQVYTYILVWFFMLGSLMAAQSMGVAGAGVALGMIKSAQKWAGGKVKNAGKRAWRETGGRAAGSMSEAINRRTEGRGRIVGTIGGLVSRPLQRVGVASRVGVEATRDAAVRARYRNYNPQERRDAIRSLTASGMNNGALATLTTMQMEEGEETGLTTAQLRTIYDSRAVSEQQRARLRRGSPALALQVLAVPPGPAPAAGTPARAAYDQAVRKRRNYINRLRTSDIEKIPRDELAQPGAGGVGTVMRDIIREMITGGDWSDSKFKALNDVDPALFLGEFDTYLGTLPQAIRGPAVPPATRGGITAAPPNHGIGTDQNYLKLARYLESTAGQGLTTVTL